MHELLQPLLFQAGHRWANGKITQHKDQEIIYASSRELGFGHMRVFESFKEEYDIVNLTGWTLWNHPDDKQPDDHESFWNGDCERWISRNSDGRPWIYRKNVPDLDLMNIGRKPKLTEERRKEIEAEKEELKIRLVKLEEELEG